jgi:hypothetical protein
MRILQHGLLDGAGNRFDPSIVRIGVNVHHSVKSVSLESQLEQKLGGNDRVSSRRAARHLHGDCSVVLCIVLSCQSGKCCGAAG